MQQLHREMELDCQRVELNWANEVALLGGDRDPGLESVGHDENLLMVGDHHHHHQSQGFSLMMQEASLQSFPSMIMMEEQQQQQAIRTPSTVLSLQTTHEQQEDEEEQAEEEEDEEEGEEDRGENPVKGKKRGRQKGPGKPKAHYMKERESSFQLVLKLPLKSRKLFCVAEFYKYMSQSSSSDSLCKVTEAYAKAGESVGVSGKTARKWVEDWEKRADGTFSESQQGKHVKVEWLLQPEHLQSKARAWIEKNCPKKGDPPRKDSIIKMFRDFCNNDLLADVQQPGETGVEPVMGGSHRKISTETARSWLHRLGFNNFKDFRRTKSSSAT